MSLKKTTINTYRERFDAMFNIAPVGMMVVGHDRRVERVNHAFVHVLHTVSSAIQGKTVTELVKAGLIPAEISYLPHGKETVELDAVQFTSLTGHPVWLQLSCMQNRRVKHQPASWLIMAKDVTDSMKAKQLVVELPSRIIQAHDEEKQIISHEIHDMFTQSLAVLKMKIQALEATAHQNMGDHAHLKPVRAILKQVDDLIDTSRNLARTLRPDLIDNIGLVAALTNLAEETETRFGIKVMSRVNCKELDIESGDALQLFRIVQEALANAVKHSRATKVQVTLTKLPHKLSISIKDNGKGFKPQNLAGFAQKKRGLGLKIMQERARRIRATLLIRSKLKQGSSITIDYPLMMDSTELSIN